MIYLKIPKVNRKSGKIEGVRWSFRSYNEKNKRYEPHPISKIPEDIRSSQDEDLVKEYCRSQSAQEDSVKHRIEQRIKWQEKYHDFQKLLDDFEIFQKAKAPNSFENDVHYLSAYAYHYFLDVGEINNIENWPLHFDRFRAWLREVKPLKVKIGSLALNTQNRVIKSLNQLLAYYGQSHGKVMPRCPHYPRSMVAEVTADEIPIEHEILEIYDRLKDIRPISADLYMTLVRTGLRINEGLGLCVKFVNPGLIEGTTSDQIQEQLIKYNLGRYPGYLCLESQPKFEPARIDENFKDPLTKKVYQAGTVPHKPLKCRKRIDPKFFRFIPVYDHDAWKIIGRRYNEQIDLLAKKAHGADPLNYLLFEGITASMFYCDLEKAYDGLSYKFKSPHKLRHAFFTWFYSKVNLDRLLTKKVGGHEDERSAENYQHLAEQIGREQSKKEMKLKKIAI